MSYTIEELIKERPKLHIDRWGKPASWGVEAQVLSYLQAQAPRGGKTIETGAGISTLTFAMLGCQHTAIMPSEPVRDNVLGFMKERGIDGSTIKIICEKSQYFLPTYAETDFDLVLIDGDHSFPMPAIDYYYLSKKLKVGGTLIIDNVELWSGDILKKFLLLEPEWKFTVNLGLRAAVFKKVQDTSADKGWAGQPYNLINSHLVPAELYALHPVKFP